MGKASRICLFTSLYLPSMGGVETYTASLASALSQMGWHPIVVACATHSPAGIETGAGIDVMRLPCRAPLNGRYPIPKRNAEARELWEWLSGQPIGGIVVNTRFYPLSLSGLEFAQEKGIVPILIEHGSAHLTMGSPLVDKGVQAVEHAMTRKCLRYPARYYAVSRKASAWLGHFGIESCGELPNSIDADAYAAGASSRDFRSELGIADGQLLAAFVGRLVPEKGMRALVEAARLLEGEGVIFALAGDGPLRAEAERSEGGALRLLGRLSRADVAALLTQAEVMCLPSRSEGFATSLLEAAACGTPSMVTNVGGTDELIPDPRFGTILPDAHPETLADALRRAKDDRAALAAQGANAAKLVREGFSWKKTAEKVIEACQAAQVSPAP